MYENISTKIYVCVYTNINIYILLVCAYKMCHIIPQWQCNYDIAVLHILDTFQAFNSFRADDNVFQYEFYLGAAGCAFKVIR